MTRGVTSRLDTGGPVAAFPPDCDRRANVCDPSEGIPGGYC